MMRGKLTAIRLFAFGCTVFVLSGSRASASEPCDCQHYASLTSPVSLSRQVAEIGIRSLQLDGRAFVGDEPPFNLKKETLKLIPPHCLPQKDATKPSLRLVLRQEIAPPIEGYDQSYGSSSKLLGGYRNAFDKYFSVCRSATYNAVQKADCMKDSAGSLYESFEKDLLSKSPEVFISDLGKKGSPNPLKGFTNEEINLLKAYHRVLNAPSAESSLNEIRALKDKLTTDEKLTLVQMFGGKFLKNYDDARKANPQDRSIVTLDQLLSSARHNTQLDAYNNFVEYIEPADRNLDYEYAGVCRDIASGQGRMLEAFGFRNVFVVTANRVRAKHATVIAQDPHHKKIYHLDYGRRNDPILGDNRALSSGEDDASVNYQLYRPDGKIAADVPSEFGKFLAEAAGFDIQNLDPLARSRGSLLAAEYTLNPGAKNRLSTRIGHGSDGMGARYTFAGATTNYLTNTHFPGTIGVVVGTQNRSVVETYSPGDFESPNYDFFYNQVEQRFVSGKLKITPRLEAKIESMATVLYLIARHRSGKSGLEAGPVKGELDGRWTTALQIDQKDWKERFHLTYRLGAQVVGGNADIRQAAHPDTQTLTINHLFFTAEGRAKLGATPEGQAYLIAATVILKDHLGWRGRAEAGIVTNHLGATARIEGRLTDDTAPYQDGTARTFSGNLFWRPDPNLQFSISGTVPMEKDIPTATSVMGNMLVSY